MKFQLEEKYYKIVKDILNQHQVEVFVFGSRSKGIAKKFSDLDFVIKEEIDTRKLNKLKNSFDESDLPFKVDVIPWNSIDESFKNHILSDLKKF
jgi:predicted nucleotidyltransferase